MQSHTDNADTRFVLHMLAGAPCTSEKLARSRRAPPHQFAYKAVFAGSSAQANHRTGRVDIRLHKHEFPVPPAAFRLAPAARFR
eukprot:7186324-Prymnesium_polylepis.1